MESYGNRIIQFMVNCSQVNLWDDLRLFFTLVIIFAFIVIMIQTRRSELNARFDFIWKLQVNKLLQFFPLFFVFEFFF